MSCFICYCFAVVFVLGVSSRRCNLYDAHMMCISKDATNNSSHKSFPHIFRKTIQVIALIAHLRTRNVSGPFIVVAPLATLPNWTREFQKWLPSVPVIRFHGTAQDRDAMLEGPLNKSKRKNADYPIIVTSYEVAIRDEKRLNKIGEFTFLVVDEGQRLKNHRCTLISSLKRIRAANRLLLSGTPIQVRNLLTESCFHMF